MAPIRLLAAGALTCALPVTLAAPSAATTTTEERLVDAVNDYRRAHELRPLRRAPSLARTSDRAARRILRTDQIRHSRPINRRYRRAGENLAWEAGRTGDVQRVVQMWADSAAHRDILLSRGVRWIGAGRDYGDFEGRRSTVWVLQVGGR